MSEIVKPEPKTREWVEGWRVALDATYMADNLPTRKAREDVHILCDMALKSLTLTTALENARKDAWQPIETAPKDGTWILLGRAGIHAMHTAFWRGGVWHCGGHQYFNNPTHWQPLPEPPSLTPPTEKAT